VGGGTVRAVYGRIVGPALCRIVTPSPATHNQADARLWTPAHCTDHTAFGAA